MRAKRIRKEKQFDNIANDSVNHIKRALDGVAFNTEQEERLFVAIGDVVELWANKRPLPGRQKKF
jgi:hypothetical protein